MTPIGCAAKRRTFRRQQTAAGRPVLNPVLCRARNRIDRLCNRIEHFRRLAGRYEKQASI